MNNQIKDKLTKMFNLVKYIQYQQEAVVSREIVRKPTGTVTLFAFDKDQGLSEHTAAYDALVYLIDGKAEVIVAGELFKLQQNEAIIIPAGKSHSLKAIERFKMILIMIRS